MLDNQLIALIITVLTNGETIAGIPGTPIAQSFQPTMQGVNTEPTAYLQKIADRRYGFLERSDAWNNTDTAIVHTETQQYETTFQLSTLATQDPNTPSQYTASDICNLCAAILQSDVAVQAFETAGVAIERITDVRNSYFTDDRGQFEASPSFDFVIAHSQVIVSTTPIAVSIDVQMDMV